MDCIIITRHYILEMQQPHCSCCRPFRLKSSEIGEGKVPVAELNSLHSACEVLTWLTYRKKAVRDLRRSELNGALTTKGL